MKRQEFLNPTTIDELVRRVVEACGQTLPADAVEKSEGLAGECRYYTDNYGNKHGTHLTDSELFDALKEAAGYDSNLKENERFFADSLYHTWDDKGGRQVRMDVALSAKQMPQAVRLINKNERPPFNEKEFEAARTNTGPESGSHRETENIMQMFDKASEKLKRPSVQFDCSKIDELDWDGDIVLKKVTRGMHKGSIAITSSGGYGQNKFYGRIHDNGELALGWRGEEKRTMIEKLLEMLNSDINGMVKRYGAKSGRCCFCRKTLTDPQSVAAGFGRTCSKHFGLQEEYRAARQGG